MKRAQKRNTGYPPFLFSPNAFVLSTWLFQRGLAVIYLIAFASIYVQIPGLLGTNGLMPVRANFEDTVGKYGTVQEALGRYLTSANIFVFAPFVLGGELSVDFWMHVVCLAAMVCIFE